MKFKQWPVLFLVLLGTPILTYAICNTNPTAAPDAIVVSNLSPVVIDPLANDSDADGDALTVNLTGSCLGTVTELGDGSIVYQGVQGQGETCNLSYTVNDGRGGSANSTIMIDSNRLDASLLFFDGFESGDTGQWQEGS